MAVPQSRHHQLGKGTVIMTTEINIIRDFLEECGKGKDAFRDAIRTYFTGATVWENVGLSRTTGPVEALALMDNFEASKGITNFFVEMLTIAQQGSKILTERIDYMHGAEGAVLKEIRVMGIFEVENGQIGAWRDYFDTSGFLAA